MYKRTQTEFWFGAAAVGLLLLGCDPTSEEAALVDGEPRGPDLGVEVEQTRSVEFFDDFEREDSDELGRTPVGGFAWERGGAAPFIGSGALGRRTDDGRAASEPGVAALPGFRLSDGVLSLEVDGVTSGRIELLLGTFRLRVGPDALEVGHLGDMLSLNLGATPPVSIELLVEGEELSVLVGEERVAGPIEARVAGESLELSIFGEARVESIGFVPNDEVDDGVESGSGASRATSPVSGLGPRADEPLDPIAPTFAAPEGGGDGDGDGGGDGDGDGDGDGVFELELDPPRATAPASDLTVPTTLYAMARFLYEPAGAPQVGADLSVLTPANIALVHGVVRDAWGQPVQGATVWARGRLEEYGYSLTRADGSYDLVIAGGRVTDVVIAGDGFLSAQRSTEVEAGDSERLDDVHLLEVDSESSLVLFQDPIEVHHAFTPNDGWSDRMATLMFRGGTQATMVYADGTTDPLPSMTVRMTEYTVGTEGIFRMPSQLPAGTAYNYALEISADEAEDMGAVSVELDTPAALYVDNYRNFPVGAYLPNGSFNRQDGRWHAEESGVVLEVVGVSGGLADLDLDGDGAAEGSTEYAQLGITDPERAELATIYNEGAELWRVSIAHFTPFDVNPSGDGGGGFPPEDGQQPVHESPALSCEGPGSIIEYESQVLGESIRIHGTPFSLEYRSRRVPGGPNRSLELTLDDPALANPSLRKVALIGEVGGRRMFSELQNPPAVVPFRLSWDGLDAFGQEMQGAQPITLCIAYGFDEEMFLASDGAVGEQDSVRFGQWTEGEFNIHVDSSTETESVRWYAKCYGNGKSVAAAEVDSITKADRFRLGGIDASRLSDHLGGWTVDVHHTLSRATATLHRGDGRERELADEAVLTASRFAGAQEEGESSVADTGPMIGPHPAAVLMPHPTALAAGPDRAIYVGTPGLVRRIDGSGVSLVAGSINQLSGAPVGYVDTSHPANLGFSGDGGPATAAELGASIPAVAADTEGGLYIADGSRVRYVDSDGMIATVAGGGGVSNPPERFPNPLSVDLSGIVDIAALPDGDGILIATTLGGTGDRRVWHLSRDGELGFVAGLHPPTWVQLERRFADCSHAELDVCDPMHVFGGPDPYDWIPVLDQFMDEEERSHVGNSIYARLSGPLTAVAARQGRSYFSQSGSNRRVRVVQGHRGGKISSFRHNYRLAEDFSIPDDLPFPSGPAGVAIDVDLDGVDEQNVVLEADAVQPRVVDLLAADIGLYYTTVAEHPTPGRLFHATDDLEVPPTRLMGGPDATAFVGGDDIRLADNVGLGSNTEVVRGPDDALYVADAQRNVILRVARMVPPMYLSSWVTSEDGSEVFLFDEEGRHLETRNARTHSLIYSFGYDGGGLLSTISDAHGRATTFHRDQDGNVTSISGPDGTLTALSMDANGYLDTVTDATSAVIDLDHGPRGLLESMSAAGSLTQFVYDSGGSLVEDRQTVSYAPPGGPPGSEESEVIPQDLVRITADSSQGSLVQHISPEMRETTYSYARQGNDITREVTFPDQTQNRSTHSPDRDEVTLADGTVVTTLWGPEPRLGPGSRAPTRITVETPDGLTRETNFERTFEPFCSLYTEGPECAVVPPDGSAELGLRADRIVEVVRRGLEVSTSTYDRAHEASGVAVPAQIVTVAASGRTTTMTLNDAGRAASVQVGSFAPVVYGYDAAGRVVSISQTDGVQTRSVTFGYHATEGWLETVTDAQNRTTTFQRDAVGRVLQQISPTPGEVIGFTYDEDGRVTSVTPPSRPGHDFRYDSAGRLREYDPPVVAGVTDPETAYTYTPDHQPDLTSLPQGDTIDADYDVTTGKLTLIDTPTADYGFSYDDGGGADDTGLLQVATVTHSDPTIGALSLTYAYDGELVTSETLAGAVSGEVSWGYDDQHRLDEESVEGDTVSYGYDSGGRLTTMGAMTATYDPTSARLDTTTLGNVTTTVSYDGFGDVSGVLYEAANTAFYEVTYTRDGFGRVETKTETRPGNTSLRCYEYDGSDRLAAVYDAADSGGCTGTQLEAYSYDLNGNRASVTNSAGTVGAGSIVTDDQDRLLQHGDWTYAYNDDGQMETRTDTSSGDVWSYTYDVMGNLLEVETPGADPTISYVTDARNRRVGKRENGVLVQGFLYRDQLNPIAELDGAGAVVSRFVYGTSDRVPDYMVRGGVTYRFVTDHLGSVVGVYDVTNGAEVQSREYDAYGRVVSETTSPGFSQPFGFAGGLYDEDTGLVRFGARDYRPEVGSWAAKDPLRFDAGDGSLFSYCYGSPTHFVDPDGRVAQAAVVNPVTLAAALAVVAYCYASGVCKLPPLPPFPRRSPPPGPSVCEPGLGHALDAAVESLSRSTPYRPTLPRNPPCQLLPNASRPGRCIYSCRFTDRPGRRTVTTPDLECLPQIDNPF